MQETSRTRTGVGCFDQLPRQGNLTEAKLAEPAHQGQTGRTLKRANQHTGGRTSGLRPNPPDSPFQEPIAPTEAVKGDNPNIRFGKWVSAIFAETPQKTLYLYRKLFELDLTRQQTINAGLSVCYELDSYDTEAPKLAGRPETRPIGGLQAHFMGPWEDPARPPL